MSSGPKIGIKIGNTNAYVAVNGQMVSNADGCRNTICMVNEDKSVGLAAQSKWVRMPEQSLDKDRTEFWEGLMEDLKITVESNSGEKFENCQTVVVTEDDRCRKFLENWKVQLCSCPDSLILDEYHDGKSDNICLVRFGGSTVSFNVMHFW